MKIAVTGASGLIGSALLTALRADGHEVLQLVRRTPRTAEEHRWDPQHRQIDAGSRRRRGRGDQPGRDAHPPPARSPAATRQQLTDSRLDSTTTISEALAAAATADPGRKRVLLSASAVGFYGDTGSRAVTEKDPAGSRLPRAAVRAVGGGDRARPRPPGSASCTCGRASCSTTAPC